MDLINAKTEKSRKLAINQVNGEVSNLIKKLRQRIIEILANIEVNIDYPEYEDIEEMTNTMIEENLMPLEIDIKNILSKSEDSKIIKEGIKTIIIGSPNVGKSSILNRLLNEEKAIVTDIEGTTRDVIEETLIIGNLVLNVSDTAGIRETDDVVEAIGVNKSLKAIDDTDMIIYLIDLSRGLNARDIELLEKIKGQNKPYIIGLNKVDISREKIEDVKSQLGNHKNIICISSKTGEGIVELKDTIEEIFNISNIDSEESRIIVNERHKDLLEKARNSVIKAKEIAEMGESLDVAAIDIKEATEMLGNITGKNASSDVVNKIFEKFCLGK
jgi:tRNA modification GTPase